LNLETDSTVGWILASYLITFTTSTRVWTWVIGQPGIRGVKASCSFEIFPCQIHSFISYKSSKFRPLESLAVRSPTSIPEYDSGTPNYSSGTSTQHPEYIVPTDWLVVLDY